MMWILSALCQGGGILGSGRVESKARPASASAVRFRWMTQGSLHLCLGRLSIVVNRLRSNLFVPALCRHSLSFFIR